MPAPNAWAGRRPLPGIAPSTSWAADGVEFLGVLAAGRERFSDAARLLTIFGREPVDVCVPFTILALLAASHARASMDNVMWAYQARQVRTW
ncbi:MAG TPA: hypothetical protein VFE26_17080 [Trebonia sp.]|nr:hypothetical protein [Trebonia sp.]